jgi:hypothetical protein
VSGGEFSAADAQAVIAFEQEMMQVAVAASGGDAAAQARLDAWQAVVLEHQPEIERMTLAAQAGDLSTLQKMQRLQLDMMHEWSRTGAPTSAKKAALPAVAKPRKP